MLGSLHRAAQSSNSVPTSIKFCLIIRLCWNQENCHYQTNLSEVFVLNTLSVLLGRRRLSLFVKFEFCCCEMIKVMFKCRPTLS